MNNKFCKEPLYNVTRTLADVAMGRADADVVITGARLVNVCTAEILDDTDVAISCGRIALVGDAKHCIGQTTKVIDAQGAYIAPGFLDGHMHIESSMMSVAEYARAVVPHGTVGVFADPHEICNVLGMEGVKCIADDAARTPLKAMLLTPSCVPAVPGFEDTGASVGPEDVRKSMGEDWIFGLGEMMNYPGIINSVPETHEIVAQTLRAGKPVTGHFAMPDSGRALSAYIASGVCCCHETTRPEDVLAKMRLGMYAQLREGSAWHDLHVIIPAILENKVDTRFAMLISDDTHSHTLLEQGHLDHIARCAIEAGADPVTAIQMITINCAQCFGMDAELGSITPGKCADIVFFRDLEKIDVFRVLINGDVAAQDGALVAEMPPYTYPDWATHSMHVAGSITPASFRIAAPEGKDSVKARVIEIIPERVGTYERLAQLKVRDGCVGADVAQDVLKLAVFERHHATGKAGFGFVKGFDIKNGAMASTVSHDAHNLMVVGSNDEDMAIAANALIECGGGMAIVSGGKVLGLVALPIAGLINQKPVEQISAEVDALGAMWRQIGCDIVSPFMTMSLLALACLPELRLTNRGLVDCREYKQVGLFVE